MTNTNVTLISPAPLSGASPAGWKIGVVDSAAKAAQNDTWTVGEASAIMLAHVNLDSTGVMDACTISTNVITLTGAGTGASSGYIIYK